MAYLKMYKFEIAIKLWSFSDGLDAIIRIFEFNDLLVVVLENWLGIFEIQIKLIIWWWLIWSIGQKADTFRLLIPITNYKQLMWTSTFTVHCVHIWYQSSIGALTHTHTQLKYNFRKRRNEQKKIISNDEHEQHHYYLVQ